MDSRYYYKRLQYKIKWTNYDKDDKWYYADDDKFEHVQDIIDDYYRRYLERIGL